MTRRASFIASIPSPPNKDGRRPTVLFVQSGGHVVGKGTVFNDMCKWLGITNLAAKEGMKGWPKLNGEVAAKLKPDWVLMSAVDDQTAVTANETYQEMARLPGWQHMPAIKEQQVLLLPAAPLSALSHHVLTALASMYRKLGGKGSPPLAEAATP